MGVAHVLRQALDLGFEAAHVGGFDRAEEVTGEPEITVDLMPADEVEHEVAGLPGELQQGAGALESVRGDQLDGALAQSGDHLAAVAARGAPADLTAFEQDDGHPAFRGVQGGGEAGRPATDNDDIRRHLTDQRCKALRGICRSDVVAVGHGQAVIEAHG